MKSLLLFLLLTAASFARAGEPPPPDSKDLRKLLQEGLFAEEADRNLVKAAESYSRILSQFDSQRAYAATALFRLAEIRLREGKKDEAITLYKRLIAEFQQDELLVKNSRERLTSLGLPVAGDAPQPSLPPAPEPPSEDEKQLTHFQELQKTSPDLLNDGFKNPLAAATEAGWLQTTAFLMDHGAKLAKDAGTTPLCIAASRNLDMVKMLLARGESPNGSHPEGKTTPLEEAAHANRTDIARLLIETGAKPDFASSRYRNTTALQVAVENGNAELATYLLEHGASADTADQDGITPLIAAVRQGYETLAALLINHGADPNNAALKGTTPLMITALRQDEGMTKLLLSLRADPNLKTPEGLTALMVAAGKGAEPIAAQLIEKGAEVNATNNDGATALHIAARRSSKTVKLLLDAGASLKARTSTGATPLLWATQLEMFPQNDVDLLQYAQPKDLRGVSQSVDLQTPMDELRKIWELLLSSGASLSEADNYKQTLLLLACVNSAEPRFEDIEWLVAHGADMETADDQGRTLYSALLSKHIGEKVREELLFPKLAKEHAVFLFGTAPKGKSIRFAPHFDFDAPPLWNDLFSLLPPNQLHDDILSVDLYRLDADGKLSKTEKVINLRSADSQADWPAVQWGDILRFQRFGAGATSSQVAKNARDTAPKQVRRITLQLGETTKDVVLSALPTGSDYWSPEDKELPPWTLSELVAAATAAEPRADLGKVTVHRQVNGKEVVYTVDLRAVPSEEAERDGNGNLSMVRMARGMLASGDRIVIPLLPMTDPAALAARRGKISRSAPGGIFGDCVFAQTERKETARTLAEAIIQCYLNPMVIPTPDLSKIVIHRLKEDGTGEEEIAVNLFDMYPNPSSARARALPSRPGESPQINNAKASVQKHEVDILLQWGDIIEIPQIAGANPEGWRGLSTEALERIFPCLSRNIAVSLNGASYPVSLGPHVAAYRHEATWQAETWGKRPTFDGIYTVSPGLPGTLLPNGASLSAGHTPDIAERKLTYSPADVLSALHIDLASVLNLTISAGETPEVSIDPKSPEAASFWLTPADSISIKTL